MGGNDGEPQRWPRARFSSGRHLATRFVCYRTKWISWRFRALGPAAPTRNDARLIEGAPPESPQ